MREFYLQTIGNLAVQRKNIRRLKNKELTKFYTERINYFKSSVTGLTKEDIYKILNYSILEGSSLGICKFTNKYFLKIVSK